MTATVLFLVSSPSQSPFCLSQVMNCCFSVRRKMRKLKVGKWFPRTGHTLIYAWRMFTASLETKIPFKRVIREFINMVTWRLIDGLRWLDWRLAMLTWSSSRRDSSSGFRPSSSGWWLDWARQCCGSASILERTALRGPPATATRSRGLSACTGSDVSWW